jgi:Secretion system C-terminal sorting domain
MKKYIYTLILFAFSININAQKMFSKIIEGKTFKTKFINAILDKDTIVVFGSDVSNHHNYFWLIKMDTTGKILSEKLYPIENSAIFTYTREGNKFIKTSDGGYAFVGSVDFDENGFLLKIKHNGDREFIKPHIPQPDQWSYKHKRIVETKDGYWILSSKDRDADSSVCLLKTDKKGERIWVKNFTNDRWYKDLLKITDNSFILSGEKKGSSGKTIPIVTYLDSLGNEQKSIFKGEKGDLGFYHLRKTKNGWVYATIEYDSTFYVKKYWLNGADDNFNTLWRKRIRPKAGTFAEINNINELANNEFIALSTEYDEDIDLSSFRSAAIVQKFNTQGDLAWHRVDTFFWSPEKYNTLFENNHSSAIGLPSGNIMIFGYAGAYSAPDNRYRTYGWVVKLSKDGCLLEPACGITSTGENFDIQAFKVFPNPATDLLHIAWEIPNEAPWRVVLSDYSGRVVQQAEIEKGNLQYRLNVEGLSNGIYFYQILLARGEALQAGKIIIQK